MRAEMLEVQTSKLVYSISGEATEKGGKRVWQKVIFGSIRFSDELAELIDQQVGDTFTQKFENLITRCVWEVPAAEKRLKKIQEEIKKERERLYNFQRATEQLRLLERDIQDARYYFGIVERRAKQIAETAEKEA